MVVGSVKDLINELLETSCYVDDTVEVYILLKNYLIYLM